MRRDETRGKKRGKEKIRGEENRIKRRGAKERGEE